MKKSLIIKKLCFGVLFIIVQTLMAPAETLKKVLNITQVDKTTACTILGAAGENLGDLTSEEKARSCIVCGKMWSDNEKNNSKALTTVCAGLGSPLNKQKEYLSQAVAHAVASPDKSCKELGMLYESFDLLSKEQRVQATSTCFAKWADQPQARKAIIKPDDIDDSKQKKPVLPSWNEVSQELVLDRADPKGQFVTDVTKEQYEAILRKNE